MPTVEGAGVELAFREAGAGPPALVIHGLASDARAWAPLVDALAAQGARAIAYDRRGYGASGAPDPYAATTVQEQGEDAAALLRGLDAAPALVVGDGFGALVALDLLVRHPGLVRAAVLGDPPLLAFVPEATEALAAQRQALEGALREGGPARAVDVWLGARVDAEARVRARAAHSAFFADYAGLASWSPARRELRAVGVPVAVVTGPETPAHLIAAADAAAGLVPGARRRVDGDLAAAAATLGSGS
jgi:pimeloyl-ACP methyl ester carboxylesterase